MSHNLRGLKNILLKHSLFMFSYCNEEENNNSTQQFNLIYLHFNLYLL